jgi:hypothetical protein
LTHVTPDVFFLSGKVIIAIARKREHASVKALILINKLNKLIFLFNGCRFFLFLLKQTGAVN